MSKEVKSIPVVEACRHAFAALNEAFGLLEIIDSSTFGLHQDQIEILEQCCHTITLEEKKIKCFAPLVRQNCWHLQNVTPSIGSAYAHKALTLAALLDRYDPSNSFISQISSVFKQNLEYISLPDQVSSAKSSAEIIFQNTQPLTAIAVLGM